MSYKFEGTIEKIFETEQKTEKFQVRDLVCESQDDKYPQLIKFQFAQDRCDLLDQYNEGDIVIVHFDLRGREWEGKYFTNLNGWKIEKVAGADKASGKPIYQSDGYGEGKESEIKDSEEDKEMPF